ncbi:hypothetical protein MRX96_046276 [Rhipicephalus microplus]
MSLALIFWFRGCDPLLSGAIASYDQILPYYVKTYLIKFRGFTGIFLTSIVSAALSTTSSIINSQAAVLYVDILAPHFKTLESNVRWTTRGIAFLLGVLMTTYSCVCVYMGSLTKLLMMAYGAATGPFVGLFILAIMFPFVHSKGAGASTLLMIVGELVAMWWYLSSGTKAPPMPVSLDYCPGNASATSLVTNFTAPFSSNSHRTFQQLRRTHFDHFILPEKMRAMIKDGVVHSPYPDVEPVKDSTIFAFLKRNIRRNRKKTAMICDSDAITHGEVLERLERCAAVYQLHGIGKGDRVYAHVSNSIDNFVCICAIPLTGATLVTSDVLFREGELLANLQNSDATHVLTDTTFAPLFNDIKRKYPFKGMLSTKPFPGIHLRLRFGAHRQMPQVCRTGSA